jgi:hypothetical protein
MQVGDICAQTYMLNGREGEVMLNIYKKEELDVDQDSVCATLAVDVRVTAEDTTRFNKKLLNQLRVRTKVGHQHLIVMMVNFRGEVVEKRFRYAAEIAAARNGHLPTRHPTNN